MSDCSKYQELICGLIDNELNTQTRDALLTHIEECPECRNMYEAFSAVSGMISQDTVEVPEALHENIMAGVRRSALFNNNKKRRARQTRSMLAAAACFAVVIFSAVGISKTLLSRESDVIRSEAIMAAEAPVRMTDSANVMPAPVQTKAPETAPQANASTPKPAATQTPSVHTSAPKEDEYAGMPKQTAEPAASENPATPVVSAVSGGVEIPNEAAESKIEEQVQPELKLSISKAEDTQKTAETQAEQTEADANSVQGTEAESAQGEGTENFPESNTAGAEISTAAEMSDETGEMPQESTGISEETVFYDVKAAEPTDSTAVAEPIQGELKQDNETAIKPKRSKLISSLEKLFGITVISAPEATSAPKADKAPDADVVIKLTEEKVYEELSKLLLGTLSELPEDKADRTYEVSIAKDDKTLVLMLRAYGEKLYYSLYDEVIAQNVYLADCKHEDFVKFVKAHPDTIDEAAENAEDGAAATKDAAVTQAATSTSSGEKTDKLNIAIGEAKKPIS